MGARISSPRFLISCFSAPAVLGGNSSPSASVSAGSSGPVGKAPGDSGTSMRTALFSEELCCTAGDDCCVWFCCPTEGEGQVSAKTSTSDNWRACLKRCLRTSSHVGLQHH